MRRGKRFKVGQFGGLVRVAADESRHVEAVIALKNARIKTALAELTHYDMPRFDPETTATLRRQSD